MSRCPSCHADVPAGETICLECGTELVLAGLASAAAASPAPQQASASVAAPAASTRRPAGACPDCGEHVTADANGLCPICGHDFAAPLHIDEQEFLREPPSLDEVRAKRRAAMDERAAPPGAVPAPAPADGPPGWGAPAPVAPSPAAAPAPAPPPGALPLPGDRTRTRWQGAGGAVSPDGTARLDAPVLVIEGGQTVFFDGAMTSRVPLDVDQIVVGRRDPQRGHYPEVDLTHFCHLDPHISRRHARIVRQGGSWMVEDLCANDATWLNDRAHVLNGESAALSHGDRILISDSIAMRFTVTGQGT